MEEASHDVLFIEFLRLRKAPQPILFIEYCTLGLSRSFSATSVVSSLRNEAQVKI